MFHNETLFSHDRLALFGFGLFETLLITAAGPLFVDLHWQRMNKGADLLGLDLPAKHEWVKLVQKYIEETPSSFPYALRVTLSGGSPLNQLPSQVLFLKRALPYTSDQYRLGIRLHLLPSPRNELSPLVSIKSTNYLENILAKEEAMKNGAEEGLWLNTKGHISEGTMSNLFFIKNETLFTPSLASGCLPGTRRQLILNLACSLQIPICEGFYPFSNLLSADEIFMTNALMGVMPVRQVDDFPFSIAPLGTKNSGMRRLELAYNEIKNAPLPIS
ncbi:MAG: aminotransferase class IV [Desulfosporosinus sp. BRH_c37]|nr:MAG: aminotransferase class IV [Desulfosporosinus sp. BRH_c37]